ncbi:MAG TPA: CinA family protein [Stenotrophobium sp.]|nr:CinA family protein [Stenotrophobium sp.]
MKSLAAKVGEQLLRRGEMLATAESCTGGLIAKRITDIAGSSGWFECGLVTYSNRAKQLFLGVRDNLLVREGAVSEAAVRAMVKGLLRNSGADWGIAVTGIAGPGGGSPDKPVGTVWLGLMQRSATAEAFCLHLNGNRKQIREQTAKIALTELLARLTHA